MTIQWKLSAKKANARHLKKEQYVDAGHLGAVNELLFLFCTLHKDIVEVTVNEDLQRLNSPSVYMEDESCVSLDTLFL